MSKRTTIIASLSLLSSVCTAAPALAQTACGPQRFILSLPMTPLAGGSRVTVPVKINGVPGRFLVGTANGNTSLNQAAADARHLDPIDDGPRMVDMNGYASRRDVRLDDFILGNAHTASLKMMMTPDPKVGIDPSFDGILAPDVLYGYDAEMDFAGGKLNYFAPDHCPGKVIYWPASAVAAVPITMRGRLTDGARVAVNLKSYAQPPSPSGSGIIPNPLQSLDGLDASRIVGLDPQINVVLDGKYFTANIDTGSEYTTLNSAAAKALFDVTADSPGSYPAGKISENASKSDGGSSALSETVTVFGKYAFMHTFHTLSLGDITVTNPHLLVRPDFTGRYDPDNEYVTGSHIYRQDDHVLPDISIGMDVLKQLHLYFAYNEGRLYVTAAGPKPAQSAAN